MALDIPSLEIRREVEDMKKESRRYQNYSYCSFVISILPVIFRSYVINLLKQYSDIINIISLSGFLIFFIIALYFKEKSEATLPILKDRGL